MGSKAALTPSKLDFRATPGNGRHHVGRFVPKAEMDNRSMIVVGTMRSPTLLGLPMYSHYIRVAQPTTLRGGRDGYQSNTLKG